MLTWKRSIGLALIVLAGTALVSQGGPRDPFREGADRALKELARMSGVTKQDFRVDAATMELEMTFSGQLRLQSYAMQQPYRAPGILEALALKVNDAGGMRPRLDALVTLARPRGSRPSRPALPPEKLDKVLRSSTPIAAAIEQVYDGTKQRFQGKDLEAVLKNESNLTPQVTEQAARLIMASLEATLIRNRLIKDSDFRIGGAFDSRSRKTANQLREFLSTWWEDPGGKSAFQAVEPALNSFDLSAFYQGGLQLAGDLDGIAEASRIGGFSTGTPEEFQYQWTTPRGEIAIGGRGDNTYRGSFMLILDLGGNDHYLGGGAASGREAVAVVVDLGGDDLYEPADSALAGPGGALLGYSLVMDLGQGTDSYTSATWGCGFGFLGVGVIHDDGGDDTYVGQWLSQGAGLFGMGILLDGGGADLYKITGKYTEFPGGRSQGFGGPAGVGMLLDEGGDDTYLVCGEESPADTTTFTLDAPHVQGASTGVQEFRAGGLGILVDAKGRDEFRACDFAQGSSVGCGLGALVDFEGEDLYSGGDHSQGSGTGMGVGLLIDVEGNDRFEGDPDRSPALGSGTDLGLGMLVDREGDDAYLGGDAALGSSSRQGAGWFVDFEGEDVYEPGTGHSAAYVDGVTTSLFRTEVPGVAVFIDLDQSRQRFPASIRKRLVDSGSHVFAPLGPASSLGGGFTPPDTTGMGAP